MRISEFDASKTIIKELGLRLRKYRIASAKTQQDVSDISGVSLSTIKSVERGEGCSLDNFIKILQSLHLASNLNDLIPLLEASPRDMIMIGKEMGLSTQKCKTIVGEVLNAKIKWTEFATRAQLPNDIALNTQKFFEVMD